MASKIFTSRTVHIGEVPLGGGHPVRVQSMTSTNTMDTEATVQQSVRMIEAGCEYVRITAQGVREAEHLAVIRDELRSRGYHTPLIADIHYQPAAALAAAKHVEKVRINPGNYVDRKRGRIRYSDDEYQAELQHIRERIKPLLDVCREHKTALRIGSNHGSLSERILLRYGDTPAGMVESALEFVSICRDLDFHALVLSMKASNVKVMVQANRLLVKRMMELGMDYPIHLGVTEAGDAEDGRIKSAAGIGPLLADGIGDTIRVSLTEDPEYEIPVARKIIAAAIPDSREGMYMLDGTYGTDPCSYTRRPTRAAWGIGGGSPPVVAVSSDSTLPGKFREDLKPDLIAVSPKELQYLEGDSRGESTFRPLFIRSGEDLLSAIPSMRSDQVLVFDPGTSAGTRITRRWFQVLAERGRTNPVIVRMAYGALPQEELMIRASVDFAMLLVDGLPDGIWIDCPTAPAHRRAELAFGILQATGERISKTEYIACPSCGRTLFDIQSTLQRIKERTSHLKGLKIGVMGCCVNGPGEMADAHYGYVGGARGKITLYKGRKIMKTGIPQEEALEELVRLIKEQGDWK